MNLLDEIIDKEQKEIIKIHEKTNEMKKKIMELKEELELITGRVVKFKRNGKIDMRSIKLNTEQQVAFNIIQKRKCEERRLKRTEEFQIMIKDVLTKIANERNIKQHVQQTVIENSRIPLERKRW
jgi:hypothetical protein